MHGPINVKSPNNISKWQMGFNSAFKGLKEHIRIKIYFDRCRATVELTPNELELMNWNITSALRENYKEQLK
jgi:hypothetical protein